VPLRLRSVRFAATATAVALTLGTLGIATAGAAPVQDKQAQATALEADINANAERLAALYEQIKAVQAKLDEANSSIADAQGRIATARAETDRLEGLVRQRAASIYKSASTGASDNVFTIDVTILSAREKYASAASDKDNALMDELDAARADLAVRQREAETVKTAAETEKATLDATKAEFEAGQAEKQALLAKVQGELKALVDQAAKARAATIAPKSGTNRPWNPGELPPVSGRAGAAVAFARAQVGKPYVYAGTGLDSYDCSGLTQAAWRAAGVGLSHNSESQINSLPSVPMDQVQPGDIVWFPGHVGIYVGGGTVVDAGNENSGVRYMGVGMYRRAGRPG
jgi:cell wall-associated NlpC family hydrolase